MWVPEKYKIDDNKTIENFINSVGLATIITINKDEPIATHTAIELEYTADRKQILRGHIAKANPQSDILQTNPNALVIFQSPIHHYISSSWYEKPNAPTYNYMSVHLYGKVALLKDNELWESVDRLTRKHEQISKCPISLSTLPQNIQGMLKGVTGFEIPVDRIEASFKLSQNKNSQDHQNIVQELKDLHTPISVLMAKTMEQYREEN